MLYEGWVLDVTIDSLHSRLVIWLRTSDGATYNLPVSYHPPIHVAIADPVQWHNLDYLANALELHPHVVQVKPVLRQHSIFSRHKSRVLELRVDNVVNHKSVAADLHSLGGLLIYHDDINVEQLFLYETRLFPFCRVRFVYKQNKISQITFLDQRRTINYLLPPLRVIRLDLELRSRNSVPVVGDRIKAIDLLLDPVDDYSQCSQSETIRIDNDDEAGILTRFQSLMNDPTIDPDIVITMGGDDRLFPFLIAKAQMYGFKGLSIGRNERLLRAPGGLAQKHPSSYMSYGIVYRHIHSAVTLYGRLHIDTKNAFAYGDGRLDGAIEISRLTRVPFQRSCRITIGQAMSSLQIYEAWRSHILIPPAKMNTEQFKTATELLTVDRGGFLFTPKPGIYENVAECDFSSMYPNIMHNFNISPETIQCRCCANDVQPTRIPFSHFYTCKKRRGIIPKALDILLYKRHHYKILAQQKTSRLREKRSSQSQSIAKKEKIMYNRRQQAIKWILVTCLSAETWLPILVDGAPSVTQIGPLIDNLVGLKTGIIACPIPLEVYSIDHRCKVHPVHVKNLVKVHGPSMLFQLHLDDERILTTTPNHPCYILKDGELRIKQAADLQEGDALPVAARLNVHPSASISELIYPPSPPRVSGLGAPSFQEEKIADRLWGDLDIARIKHVER
ncbi:MAG: DNA polymerase domain-containing protein, partial [Candidatus Ranarchaeia archaeon]